MSGYSGWNYGQCRPVLPEFIGVPAITLQLWLTQAQMALQQLTTENIPISVSYTQDAGSKSVTYARSDVGTLTQRIRDLAYALNLSDRRRPMRPRY